MESFTAITGTSQQVARHFLRMTDGDVQQGIQLFFDSPDLGTGISQDPQMVDTLPSHVSYSGVNIGRTDAEGVVHLGSDDDTADAAMDIDENEAVANNTMRSAAPPRDYEDDEAMARRMQEELYGGSDGAAPNSNDVRAPIARTTETLVGGPDEGWWGQDDMQAAVLQQMRARPQPRAGMNLFKPSTFEIFPMRLQLKIMQHGLAYSTKDQHHLLYGIRQTLPQTGRV